MTESRIIPLFPLGVALLPKMKLPLHIFEARYKQMISHCLRTQSPFGIVLFDGRAIRQVGCMATISEVVERYDDGRIDILTRGGERFVVQRLIEEKSYLEAQVSFFDDNPEVPADDLEAVTTKAWELIREMADADLGIDTQELLHSIPSHQLSFAIASLEGFSPAERQGFLEMTSPSERLRKSVQALTTIVTRNRLTAEIQKVIGGNGHPPRRILDALHESTPK
jgi:Lon protease-like protein